MSKEIFPKRKNDFSLWYNSIVKRAELAENSSVRGCMIIKPYGFAIWEKMKEVLDKAFKDTGHSNAYFPIFIPKSYLSKEANHVEGFAKECAVVTHYRLKADGANVMVDPEAKLEEELIVRPTSETIIWATYKNWIKSYRDLPLLINQWSNVVRWEMRPRLFLRTAEILWQEGHTAHTTEDEALEEAIKILQLYEDFAKNYMAMPLIIGTKTENEKFAGAETTYTIEALMQDGKALQAGTSHFLGQRFSKAFDVKFANSQGILEYVWGSSWGVTTRLIGALIMTHSDDSGLILPPMLAPIQVVIIPIYRTNNEEQLVLEKAKSMLKMLLENGVLAKLDANSSYTPGWKFAEYELKGVPLRIAIGPNDVTNNTFEVIRRDTKEKKTLSYDNFVSIVKDLLAAMQNEMYLKALNFLKENTHNVNSYEEFKEIILNRGGFVMAHWDGTTATEKMIKNETKATIRCIPMNRDTSPGVCIFTGKPSIRRVLFAQAY